MLERTDAITKEVLEPITFVLVFPTVSWCDLFLVDILPWFSCLLANARVLSFKQAKNYLLPNPDLLTFIIIFPSLYNTSPAAWAELLSNLTNKSFYIKFCGVSYFPCQIPKCLIVWILTFVWITFKHCVILNQWINDI
jgi:hypothetical protein